MPSRRVFSEIRLVNGSTGDPVLYVDYPGTDDALLFDAGDNSALEERRLRDLTAVFITHHHVDHFIGFDRIVRANIDRDKTLAVFGPQGTIRKTYDRIKSYEYQFFPFQRIVMRVCDVLPEGIDEAVLECRRRFPEPQIESRARSGRAIYENDEVAVEAVPVDHTVSALAYGFIEKAGHHFDAAKLETGLLRPGPWIAEVLCQLKAGSPRDTIVSIQGGEFRLGDLAGRYFSKSRGARIAFITDTAFSPAVRDGLIELARGAQRLYCDCFYAEKHRKQAERHRHMTTTDAANLARLAGVEELVLMHFSGRYAGKYEELLTEARELFPNTTAEI